MDSNRDKIQKVIIYDVETERGRLPLSLKRSFGGVLYRIGDRWFLDDKASMSVDPPGDDISMEIVTC